MTYGFLPPEPLPDKEHKRPGMQETGPSPRWIYRGSHSRVAAPDGGSSQTPSIISHSTRAALMQIKAGIAHYAHSGAPFRGAAGASKRTATCTTLKSRIFSSDLRCCSKSTEQTPFAFVHTGTRLAPSKTCRKAWKKCWRKAPIFQSFPASARTSPTRSRTWRKAAASTISMKSESVSRPNSQT